MKYALVCGASKGIGFEIAKQLSNQDIGIIGIARDMTSLEHAKNQWSNPEKHLIYAVDMLDTSSLIDLVARLKEATKH
nr:SDR family NAD(P)-dependent oxidoreductase [Chitinophagales bacterium]